MPIPLNQFVSLSNRQPVILIVTEKDTIPLSTKRYIHPAAEPITHTKRRQEMWMSTQQSHKIPGPDCGALWGGLEDMVREAKSEMWEVDSTWLSCYGIRNVGGAAYVMCMTPGTATSE